MDNLEKKTRKPRGRKIIIHLLFIVSLAGALIFTGLRDYLLSPTRNGAPDQIFFVFEGSRLREVASMLEKKEIIKHKRLFLICARLMGYSKDIKAGEYRLNSNMSPLMILDIMRRGTVVIHHVTIPEGFTREQIATVLEKQGLVNKDEFLKLTGDPNVAKSYGISCPNLEGFLYPDTYNLRWGLPTRSVIDMMVSQFQKVVAPLRDRMKKLGMTMEQVVILASIVEKETGRPEERPVIASVFLNRLKAGKRLESDPTVIYGIANFSGNITKKDLRSSTPYNTYIIKGLPPSAIANPGKDAIRAVLYPAHTKYLYFVSKNDGSHQFSRTLSEHNLAVKAYQKNRHQTVR